MLVRECMTKKPVTVRPADTLASAHTSMKERGFRRLPVVQEGELIGILSEYDLRRYFDSRDSVLVGAAMTRNPITISPSATLEHAVTLLNRNEIGALLVVDHGILIGIVTANDMWV
jgi:acetoin utilization protein AcuB